MLCGKTVAGLRYIDTECRAVKRTIITDEDDKKKERYMISEALKVCRHPQWTFRSVREKIDRNAKEE